VVEYKKYIKNSLDGEDKGSAKKNLCIFCHFDSEAKIYDYVVNYLKNLAENCDFEIIFVSNCPEIGDEYLNKIKLFVSKVILRENVGYDFAAYMTGFLEAGDKEKYQNILFANDSVYGPFYSLKEVFQRFENEDCDVWGITDNTYSTYHLQSYFLNFKVLDKTIKFLNSFFENFEFLDDKEEIVRRYEVGISTEMLKAGLKLKAFCDSYEVVNFELDNSDDEFIARIKESIGKNKKFKFNLKRFFSNKEKRLALKREFAEKYLIGPQFSSWYTSIKYFKNPFIKCNLVNNPNLYYFHEYRYNSVLQELYPEFDINLINSHSHVKRVLDFKGK
jgi:lipopolysaccharide biosynthesis protein